MGALTVALLILVWVLRLVVQVMGFRDPFVPLSEDVSFLVRDTFWGTVWLVQGALLPLLAAAFWIARPGALFGGRTKGGAPARPTDVRSGTSPAWWAVGVLVLLLVATVALSSHAMGVESGRAVAILADGVHALGAGAWIGSLGLILAVGRPEGGFDGGPLLAAQLRSFSRMAIVSVTALVATGTLLSWTHLDSVGDLWGSPYGRILSVKVLLAGAVFLLGLLNWRRGLPVLDTEEGLRGVRRRATWEVTLAAGVLLVAAVLGQTAEP